MTLKLTSLIATLLFSIGSLAAQYEFVPATLYTAGAEARSGYIYLNEAKDITNGVLFSPNSRGESSNYYAAVEIDRLEVKNGHVYATHVLPVFLQQQLVANGAILAAIRATR